MSGIDWRSGLRNRIERQGRASQRIQRLPQRRTHQEPSAEPRRAHRDCPLLAGIADVIPGPPGKVGGKAHLLHHLPAQGQPLAIYRGSTGLNVLQALTLGQAPARITSRRIAHRSVHAQPEIGKRRHLLTPAGVVGLSTLSATTTGWRDRTGHHRRLEMVGEQAAPSPPHS